MVLILLIAQFNLYYQHNFGEASYIWGYHDINGDGHKDAVVLYDDSACVFTLPDNQLRATYLTSPYEHINFLTTFGNSDALIFKYSYNSGTYTGKIYYYTDYVNISWESSEIVSYFYTYPLIYIGDMDGDGYYDIAVSYREADSTLTFLIYKGNISKVKEKRDKDYPSDFHASLKNITFNLSHAGLCKIEFYNKAGRQLGVYFYKGKRGQNLFVPPFITEDAVFYRIIQGDRVIYSGAFLK